MKIVGLMFLLSIVLALSAAASFCVDCAGGCMYPMDAAGNVLGPSQDCPPIPNCVCQEVVPVGGNPSSGYVEPQTPGVYWEGQCVIDEPDIPEFTLIGAGLAMLGAGIIIWRRTK